METQIFFVGYDQDTGFARAIHAVPEALAGEARSIAGLGFDPEGDWPLSQTAARQIAALIGAEIDTDSMEFCLEPHQDPQSVRVRTATANSK